MPVTNIPAPGSPIRSNWAQSVSNVANAAETAIPTKVAKVGDQMSGDLTVGGAPTAPAAGVQLRAVGRLLVTHDTSAATSVFTRIVDVTTGKSFITFQLGAAQNIIGTITVASGTAVAYNTSSDPRLKSEVGPITDAADRVRALGAAAYRGVWTADQGQGQEWDLVDATDVATVAPYAVTGDPDAVTDTGEIDPMQVNYPALVPLLCAALGDALDRIEVLEAGVG